MNLSLERGNSDGSCVAYVFFGKIAGPQFGDYKAGFRFAQLGYELVEKHGLERFQGRTYLWFGQFILPWTKHLRHSRDLTRRAFDAAYKVGDLTIAAYSFDHLNANSLATGDPLIEAQRVAENGLEFVGKARFGMVIDIIGAQLSLMRTLRGLSKKFGFFDDEANVEHHFASVPEATLPQCWYWIRKLQARFFAGEYDSALDAAAKALRLLWTSPSIFEAAEYHFYGALSHAASCDSATPEGQQNHLEALTAHHRQLEIWAENCPENFENRAALVAAEIERLKGQPLKAEYLYEQAIRSASANGFIHNEAVANELAARFYAARGFHTIAHTYLRKARHCYVLWGADGKVRQLEEQYPQLRQGEPTPGPTSTIGTSAEHLDLATVIKVSQAVAGEIVLEKLIDTLMRTAIQHAGAERGVLILPRGVQQWIEAEATTCGETIIVRLEEAPMADAALPESIVHYVARTRESVILDDASVENAFSADPYIRRHQARSILCLPLINQAKVIAVLYLENHLTSHVFTPPRITVLKLLASMAAISLENTRLYRDVIEREAKIRRLVDANIVGIFIWNFEGEIIEANEAFLQMLKYSREDLVLGRVRWTDLTPAERRDRDQLALAEIKATGSFQPFEKEFFRKDGNRVPVVIGGVIFESGKEGVAFVLDLSEQKRAEAERKRAEEALQKAQAELAHVTRVTTLGELTASIAHEVNQPLAAISNNVHACLRFLAAGSKNLEEVKDALSDIVKGVDRASSIIVRMRALAKKVPPELTRLRLEELVSDVLTLIHHELTRRQVTVQTELPKSLLPILGDRVQLQQVLLNLIMNGVEAMTEIAEGKRKITIRGRSHQHQGRPAVLVSVQDSGVGLRTTDVERLFEAFYTTKAHGIGMGLAISRSIVEAHGGRLWAAPTVPGATFEFILRAET